MGKVKEIKTGRKGGPLNKAKKTKIKNDIICLIDKGRFSEINNNKLDYARQNKINRKTLNKILEELVPELDQVNSDLIKVDIMALYERMKRRILYWWDKCENADEEQQSFILEKQVFKEMREVLRDFKQTCIDLGVIEKVAEKHEIQGQLLIAGVDFLSRIDSQE